MGMERINLVPVSLAAANLAPARGATTFPEIEMVRYVVAPLAGAR